jgi:hypothetical protein
VCVALNAKIAIVGILDYDAKIAIVFMSKLDIKKYKPP